MVSLANLVNGTWNFVGKAFMVGTITIPTVLNSMKEGIISGFSLGRNYPIKPIIKTPVKQKTKRLVENPEKVKAILKQEGIQLNINAGAKVLALEPNVTMVQPNVTAMTPNETMLNK